MFPPSTHKAKSMSSSSLNSLSLLVSLLAVSGCNPDTVQPPSNALNDVFNEAIITGEYVDRHSGAMLAFDSGSATLITDQGSMEKPVKVSGDKVTLLMEQVKIVESRAQTLNLSLQTTAMSCCVPPVQQWGWIRIGIGTTNKIEYK